MDAKNPKGNSFKEKSIRLLDGIKGIYKIRMTKSNPLTMENAMETGKWFKKLLESFETDLEFRLERIILDLTESISKRMKERNMSRTQLARVLKVSPPAVTKILNGTSNFTLKTLLSLADALDMDLHIRFSYRERLMVNDTSIESERFISAYTSESKLQDKSYPAAHKPYLRPVPPFSGVTSNDTWHKPETQKEAA